MEVHRLESPSHEALFLKLTSGPRTLRLEYEAARLVWALAFLPVPEVIGRGVEDGVDWLITRGLAGADATAPEMLARPEGTVKALAKGLRWFHDSAPVEACPFDSRLEKLLAVVRARAESGAIQTAGFHEEHSHLDVKAALAILESRRPREEHLVVCHGDYCFPNALLVDGKVTGYVDLGELGIADRWWDIAVASWSTTWNVGPGYEDLFIAEYGVERDDEKIGYYRLLYDLVS